MENNQIKNCPVCGTVMKFVEAGVSRKTNKSYKAFYSCRGCNKTAPAGYSSQDGQNYASAPKAAVNAGLSQLLARFDELQLQLDSIELTLEDLKRK